MTSGRSSAQRLRDLMEKPGIICSLGAHDVLTGLLIEQAGFETVFVGGFGTSASLYALPDLGFLGIAEMVDAVRRLAQRVSIPVIADGDTGHGDIHNVVRTINEFERAGAAAIILEDQVFPKRCGHFEGKQVINSENMVLKIKAAVRAKDDEDFMLIARTDALESKGLDDAIERVNAYCDAGADVAFIEAPLSMEDLDTITRRVEYPKFVNMLAFGNTPILSVRQLEDMGYKIVAAPIDSVLLTAKAMQELAGHFKTVGHTKALMSRMMSLTEMKQILGVEGYLSLRESIE